MWNTTRDYYMTIQFLSESFIYQGELQIARTFFLSMYN